MNEPNIFETIFINKRKASVNIHEGGKTLTVLPPGGKFKVAVDRPTTTYARFEKVTFEEDGSVTLAENRGWRLPAPENTWPVEFVNEGGAEIEAFRIEERHYECYKGIPRVIFVPVSALDWVWYERVRLTTVMKREIDEENPKYFVQRPVRAKIKKTRPAQELARIKEAVSARFPDYRVPDDVEAVLKP